MIQSRVVLHQVLLFTLMSGFLLITHSSMAQETPTYTKKTYVYKQVENMDIHADVYVGSEAKSRPVVMWIHGGALIFGNREGISKPQLVKYIQAGYAVVSIDYRLAPETKLPAIIEDLKDAYRWIRQEGPSLFSVDPDRIAVVGHSAGGYLTLMAGFVLDPRPKALVSFYGYGDLTGPWYSQPSEHYLQAGPVLDSTEAWKTVGNTAISETRQPNNRFQFYLYLRQQGLWPNAVSGHDPNKESDWFKDYQPIQNIDAKYPPTLFLHGQKDTDVPFELSQNMANELQQHGVEQALITHPEWEHGFDGKMASDPEAAESFNQVLFFLRKHLGQ